MISLLRFAKLGVVVLNRHRNSRPFRTLPFHVYTEFTFIIFTQAHNFLSKSFLATFVAFSFDGKVDNTIVPFVSSFLSLLALPLMFVQVVLPKLIYLPYRVIIRFYQFFVFCIHWSKIQMRIPNIFEYK